MSSSSELRVMTYNVRSLRDSIEALTSVVRHHDPDVLLVQEAPRFARWRSKRAAVARRCGLVVATTDRPGGLCIMTHLRADVVSTSFTLLPKTPKLHQRAVVSAEIEVRGTSWKVATVHLSTNADERRAHLAPLLAALGTADGVPLVIGGDLNEDPDGPVFSDLAGRFQDSFAVVGSGSGLTSPATSPVRRLDAILAGAGVTVVSCQVLDDHHVEMASDHRPVLAVLRANGPSLLL